MKNALVVAAVLVAMCAGSAMAADGQISKSMLSDLGLSSVQVMTDAQGLEVRGMGASAWGYAAAWNNRAFADAGYRAHGPFGAGGDAFADVNGPPWAFATSNAYSF